MRVPFHEAPVEKATPFSALRRYEAALGTIAAMGRSYRPRFRVSTMLCDWDKAPTIQVGRRSGRIGGPPWPRSRDDEVCRDFGIAARAIPLSGLHPFHRPVGPGRCGFFLFLLRPVLIQPGAALLLGLVDLPVQLVEGSAQGFPGLFAGGFFHLGGEAVRRLLGAVAAAEAEQQEDAGESEDGFGAPDRPLLVTKAASANRAAHDRRRCAWLRRGSCTARPARHRPAGPGSRSGRSPAESCR